ncbi:endonuclease/exonuclease/phosphatase family protein [Streptomyces sp. TG1A-8]|uniref:endonuclease/exonuclease/phosphatase family protein n=1 Tax=Streptomyces sp. TG1A-8 TaxID=3051385 RepID=UPI00265C5F5A|nr:endonuclease/exonuclease/phosphatase family protein [Streptomyces sp. TG1A-8]MDO0927980.1 endonuclease/exonuclease/phosphatase family protein [Streptomyces sp. TG1A-8]
MTQQAYRTGTDNGDSGPGRPGSRLRRLTHRLTHRLLTGWRGDPRIWRRGTVVAALALLLALVMLAHSRIPNRIGNLGSLTDTFLPWLGLAVPVLLVLGLVRRSATALIAVLLPAIVWLNLFGGLLTDKSAGGGDLMVATHNVNADNPDPAATARDVASSGADLLALEELPASQVPVYERALAPTYGYHAIVGTVGLWSRYPMSGVRAVDIKLGWKRAMRATVATPAGPLAVYVAHLPSVRVKMRAGFTARQRDKSADALGEAIAGESLGRVVLLGDLNGTMNDRALNAVTSQMRSTQGAAGSGFGFSWPASFPMARIDQIMVKGVEPESSWTLPRTGSDHLPVAARVKLEETDTSS